MDPIINYHFLEAKQGFQFYDLNRSSFQRIFAEMLSSEPLITGRVLDIGCGHSINPIIEKIAHRFGQLDGVDPFPAVGAHHAIRNRWVCPLESIPVEAASYDMAYSYNVVEHVENVDSFLTKAMEVLKPGGVYFSLSPNARHPFTWATRLMQALNLTSAYRAQINEATNDYPAYYRVCNDALLLERIKRLSLPVSQLDFYYIPNVHWDYYFPKSLRIIPNLLDRWILLRLPKWSFVFMFRVQKVHAQ